jgi:hypothetical protein
LESTQSNGSSNIGDLVKATSMSREEVYGALGWLGREDKIQVERRGRAIVFSLRETEASSEAVKDITIEDSVPQEKSKPRRSVAPKKPAKARKPKTSKVKAPLDKGG